MKKFILSFFLMLAGIISFSQNLNCNIINDSIFPIVDSNYWKAKDSWLKLEKKYPIDNRERLLFINCSYENKDIKYFKEQLKFLIENNGFEITEKLYWLSCYQDITTTCELNDWYKKTFKKYHKKWLNNNIEKLETINAIEQLYVKDQLLASMFLFTYDTCKVSKEIKDKILRENYTNLNTIVGICKKTGNFPNAYDYPLSILGKIETIIAHNLKDSTNLEMKWNLILPYVEKAYFDGKISDSFFHIYDKFLFEHFGYQYYGFLKDAPIKNIDTYEQRRRKYKL